MSEQRRFGTAGTLSAILIQAGSRDAQVNPTLATGDVQVSKDGGAFANIATLPSVFPAGSVRVNIPLSTAELSCRMLMIRFKDQAGAEWEEQTILVETYGHSDAEHYNMGKIRYDGVVVLNTDDEHAVHIESQFAGRSGMYLDGSDTGAGLHLRGGSAGRDMDYEDVVAVVPAGFQERIAVTSENITRAGYPNMGALFTGATSPSRSDFDGKSLIGARVIAIPANPLDATGDKVGIILGGYFFDTTTDTTHEVFGVALEPMFGITEGGSTIINSNWIGGAGDLDETASVSGWTFILAEVSTTYQSSASPLSISRSSSLFFREPITAAAIDQQAVRDAMKLAPSAGAPVADSIDEKLDTTESKVDTAITDIADVKADTAQALIDIAAVQVTVDSIAATAALEATSASILAGVTAIVAKLPVSGLISNFTPSVSTVDGVTYDHIFELCAALVNGRYALDVPDTGNITFYKRDNLTVLTIVNVAQAGRTRIS